MKKLLALVLLIALLTMPLLCACDAVPEESQSEKGSKESVSGTEKDSSSKESSDGERPVGTVYANPSAIGSYSTAENTLPSIHITVDNYNALIANQSYQSMTVSTSGSTDPTAEIQSATGEIRCRGNATYSIMEKKSFRIKLTEAANLFGQDEGTAKNWVLLAEHCDRSFLRNRSAQVMAEVLGVPHSSSSFVKLYINGKYYGIYHLMEQAQIQENRVDLMPKEGVKDTDYLIELDSYAYQEGVEGLNWFRVAGKSYAIKNDNPTAQQCTFLKNYFTMLDGVLAGKDRATIEQYIDVSSFVDMYLIQAVSKNTDAGYSSFFLAKKAGGKLYCVWPWDFDIAFGNDERLDNGAAEGLYVGDPSSTGFTQHSRIFLQLMACDWFRDEVKARWEEVSDELYDAVMDDIDRLVSDFGDDFESNFDVWNTFGKKMNVESQEVISLPNYEAHVNYLRNWITDRFNYLDEYFAAV